MLRNETTGALLATHVRLARTSWSRIVGLLPRTDIDAEEGMLFERCSAIHTVGMRSPIDVIFLDRFDRVREIQANVTPGKGRVGCASACKVLEMGPGFIGSRDVLIGDLLKLYESSGSQT